jgi:hypothetical protein
MTIHLMAPSNDVSVAKKVLIPATVATAIGIAGLGGFQHTGERICTQAEMCQPEKIRLPDRHDPEPSIPLQGQVRTLTVSSTAEAPIGPIAISPSNATR